MRRLSGYLLAGAMLLLPALYGDGAVYAQEKTLTFDGDTAILTVAIKPDKTADFEQIMKDVSAALMKSEKPERKQQAAGWNIYKTSQAVQGNTAYIMIINPVVKGQEYDISRLIAEVFPVEVQEIFQKYKDSFAGRGITPLTTFMKMGQ